MTDAEVLKLIGGGGFAIALLALLWRIGERMILAIDKIGTRTESFGDKIGDHTKAHAEALGKFRIDMSESIDELGKDLVSSTADLRQDLAVIDGRLQQFKEDWSDQLTPVTRARVEERQNFDPHRRPTDRGLPLAEPLPEQRTPTGEYAIHSRSPSNRDVRGKKPR